MQIPLNLAVIGAQNECPIQVIARVHSTNKRLPITQLTTTKRKEETDESYIFRLRKNLQALIIPYGYAHQIALFCRYKIRNDQFSNDQFSNDQFQNISAQLWHIAQNSENHMERVKALSLHLDLINQLPNNNDHEDNNCHKASN